MTSHRAPVFGDYRTARVTCCGRLVSELPDEDELVPDGDPWTCEGDQPPHQLPSAA